MGGAYVLDAAIERVDRIDGAFRVVAQGTTKPGPLSIETDDVIIATGFRTPLLDLPALGVETVADGRIPALTPFFESIGAPGIYFAGNASGGAAGLLKVERAGQSTSVNGFRYNARLLAHRIAERHFGRQRDRPAVEPGRLVGFLLDELTHSPELWVQRGYLARVVSFEDGPRDEGYEPLTHFVDATAPDAVAAAVELAPDASIAPVLYIRRGGAVSEHQLPPHPLHAYETDDYRVELERALSALVRVPA
jgi:hypothetical protein